MKALSTLHIYPNLPAPLAPLWDLSYDLWWTWNQDAIRLMLEISDEGWIASGRNPLRFLAMLDQERLDQLAADAEFVRRIDEVVAQHQRYYERQPWYDAHQDRSQRLRVAYFSAEFGLAESLAVYSGGLGILAGDHLKAASDLGIPLVGVGLLYRQGYFHQALNPDGWQLELYPENPFDEMPINKVEYPSGEPIVIEVEYPNGPVFAQVWSVQVGRITLYLLDTNLERNRPEDQEITALLYGGDREMRVRQELLLGIGGLRALHEMGIEPTICHMNEGHSAFLALERIRLLMEENGHSFADAREASTAGNVFTTHTPVAAGNDWFAPDLVEAYLGSMRQRLGLSREEFLALGRIDPADQGSDFCMTVLALRLSAQANGVSRLHGEISRKMWSGMWPGLGADDVPITSVTNGVHAQTWASLEMAELFDRHMGESWRYSQNDPDEWQAIDAVPDRELWAVHQHRRQRLVDYSTQHLRTQLTRHGMPPGQIDQTVAGLDPQALTIGFARRFATYKRGTLIFRNIERLAALFAATDRPVQLIFAGKAHPHDHPGKEFIRTIVHLARQEPFAGKVFFLEDYDMNVARYLVQGCDVWLNNPRRPLEASGTSGMKAALNGALNISVLDGWWVEACEDHGGWTIGQGEDYEDLEYQDEVESNALYDLLETEVIPAFYQRDAEGIPHAWVARMKEAIRTLAPRFNTSRMVRQYTEQLYLPNQARWDQLNADHERIRSLSEWKARVRSYWSQVAVRHLAAELPPQAKVGSTVPLEAHIELGELTPDDVQVELYMGKVNSQKEIQQATTSPLALRRTAEDGSFVFGGEFPCQRAGSFGYTVRVIPAHADLRDPLEMGLVCWATP